MSSLFGNKVKRDPLPLLPELQMLNAVISKVEFRPSMFQGKPQYVTDYDTKEIIYDDKGQPIPRKEFNITFEIQGHSLSNGAPRKTWLALNASTSEKSKLQKLLHILMIELYENSDTAVIDALTGREVRFQLVNKVGANNVIYQNINFESIRCVVNAEGKAKMDKVVASVFQGTKSIKPEDIEEWKD
jgi:hypothetical protein